MGVGDIRDDGFWAEEIKEMRKLAFGVSVTAVTVLHFHTN